MTHKNKDYTEKQMKRKSLKEMEPTFSDEELSEPFSNKRPFAFRNKGTDSRHEPSPSSQRSIGSCLNEAFEMTHGEDE